MDIQWLNPSGFVSCLLNCFRWQNSGAYLQIPVSTFHSLCGILKVSTSSFPLPPPSSPKSSSRRKCSPGMVEGENSQNRSTSYMSTNTFRIPITSFDSVMCRQFFASGACSPPPSYCSSQTSPKPIPECHPHVCAMGTGNLCMPNPQSRSTFACAMSPLDASHCELCLKPGISFHIKIMRGCMIEKKVLYDNPTVNQMLEVVK